MKRRPAACRRRARTGGTATRRHAARTALALTAATATACTALTLLPPPPAAAADINPNCRPERLTTLTKAIRAEAGLGTVASDTAQEVARRSADLRAAGNRGHHNASVTSVATAADTCERILESLMGSPPHRYWILHGSKCGAGWGVALIPGEPARFAVSGDFDDEGPEACEPAGSPALPSRPAPIPATDRYATAAGLSQASFDPGAQVAYIAAGEGFADALAAANAARAGWGPLLLVTRASIPPVTAAELRRLRPGKIVVLGGPGAVSSAVESSLLRYASKVTRIAGADRYATAAAASAAHFGPGVDEVYVATGEDYPDALAAGPVAAQWDTPILLTARDRLPAATARELTRLKPRTITVIGGPGAVSDRVVGALGRYATSRSRRYGRDDRYATAAALSAIVFKPGDPAYIATGADWPDALAAAAAGAAKAGPVLLVARTGVPAATARELARLKPGKVVVAGGEAVVPPKVRAALARYQAR